MREFGEYVLQHAKPSSEAIDGCPTFATAYVGRKRWAQPNDRFPAATNLRTLRLVPKGRLKVAQHVVLGQLRQCKSVPSGTAESHMPPPAVPGGSVPPSTQDCV